MLGLAMSIGLEQISVEGATGSYDTLLNAKAKAMCEALSNREFDFGLLHVKAVDDAGHDGDTHLKVKLLEQIDRMVGQIIKRFWMQRQPDRSMPLLIVASDHSTPVVFGDHSNEPVPVVLAFLEKTVAIPSSHLSHSITRCAG